MKLAEALAIVKNAPAEATDFSVLLACGFTPLHLLNYLAAYLQTAMPGRKVRVRTGLYDDVCGTLEQFAQSGLLNGLFDPEAALARTAFETNSPDLYHRIEMHG
ncbi:MAG: hypothetical protein ACRD4O_14445 [Bryobacteraceae bacterium]